jgi:hypothetical protein
MSAGSTSQTPNWAATEFDPTITASLLLWEARRDAGVRDVQCPTAGDTADRSDASYVVVC